MRSDSKLEQLATGVYFELAPEESPIPFVVVDNTTPGVEDWAFDGEPMQNDTWTVKGVGEAADAEAIADRCRELLNMEELAITGRELLFLRSQTNVNFMEEVDGRRYQHVGHTYKLISERI